MMLAIVGSAHSPSKLPQKQWGTGGEPEIVFQARFHPCLFANRFNQLSENRCLKPET
jgi:hypothetical protein